MIHPLPFPSPTTTTAAGITSSSSPRPIGFPQLRSPPRSLCPFQRDMAALSFAAASIWLPSNPSTNPSTLKTPSKKSATPNLRVDRYRTALHSKRSSFQDFQGLADPVRLLSVSEAKFCTKQKLEEMLTFTNLDMDSLYILQLCTSNEFGSGLMGLDAAILFCLIDQNGNSVLQRISAALTEDSEQVKDMPDSRDTRFQRGSIDTIIFEGPKMGKLQALWIGVESGSWRLGGVRLIITTANLTEGPEEVPHYGQSYDFEVNDMLLGEGEGMPMAELRPILVADYPLGNSSSLSDIGSALHSPMSKKEISNEQGMKEYEDLKLSLLIYDVMLVSAGTTILSVFSKDETAIAFLFGGISGFLYLLLLQKSVDGLSAVDVKTENLIQTLRGFKGPLSKLALLLVLSVIIAKYGLGNNSLELTPLELFAGVAGFLTCKIAVLIAAFKPLETSRKEDM